MNERKTILLVEDEPLVAMVEKRTLEKSGYAVITADTGEQAMAILANIRDVDLVLMDIDLGDGIDGTEAAEQMLLDRDLPVVFLSSHTEPEIVQKTEGITSYGYIVKNSGETVLLASIKMAFRLFEAHVGLKTQKEQLDRALVQEERAHEQLESKSEELERYFSSSLDMLCIANTEGKFVRLNPEWEKVLGYSLSELEGRPFIDFVHPDDQEPTHQAISRLADQQELLSFENRFRCKDGSYRWIEWRSRPVGEMIYAVARDVTGRKQAEDALREGERKLRVTLESIGDGVITTDAQGNVVRMNSVAESLCGWSRDDACGRSLLDVFRIVNAETRAPVDNPVIKVLENGEIAGLANHTVLITKDGAEYQIADSAAPIRDDDGTINGVVLVFRDVTEQYEKDRQLRERVKELNCLYKISEIVDEPNITLESILQKTAEMLPASWLYPEEAACRITIQESEYRSCGFTIGQWILTRDLWAEGRRVGTVEIHYPAALNPKQGSADHEVFLDEERALLSAVAERLGRIIERKRAETALAQERRLLSMVLDTIDDAIIICDENARIYRFNEAARRLHGLPEKPVASVRWSEHYDLYEADGVTPLSTETIPLFRAFKGEHVRNAEIVVAPKHAAARVLSCNGGRLVDEMGNRLGAVVAMHDITAHKQANDEIRSLLREKDGLLREVQHRVKNTMNTMVSLLTLEADRMSDNPAAAEALSDASSRFRSMGVLYDQLYRVGDHTSVSVEDYITELVQQLAALFPAGDAVRLRFDLQDFVMDGRRLSSLGMIVNELVTNAMKYAFRERGAGELNLSVQHSNGQARLVVEDDGPGMPADFDANHHAGFGLTMIEALAQNLDGEVRFEQNRGLRAVLEFTV